MPNTGLQRIIDRLRRTYAEFQRHDGDLLAAAVAYYSGLALFPLILVLISGLGLVLRFTALGQNAQVQVLSAISDYASPALSYDVERMLEQIETNAAVGGPLGVFALLLTAIAMFVQFERAFGRIWETPSSASNGILAALRELLFYRLKAFSMLLALGAVIFVIFLAGIALTTARTYLVEHWPAAAWTWSVVQIAVSVSLNAIVAAVIYRVLPRALVRWSAAFQGGLIVSIVWEIGRMLLAAFLIRNQYSAYGVVGSFLAVMLWIYYANLVLFLGAEYVRVLGRVEG